ncbi:MAG: phage tail protein, partial [Erysipelotrichaceae bacterium]|nr:phage tail protein [Erysipelotrichaceae bacterium]
MVQIGKAAVDFGKQVVMSYAEFEQLEGGVKKLFGDEDAATVIRNAQNAFKTAGMSANEYMETVTSFSASLISSLGDDTAQAARLADIAIRDMSDNANTFGTDIQSLQNAYQGFAKGQYNMLDNLKLGYGGTKSEMERLIKDAEKLNTSFKAQRYSNGDLAMSFSDIVAAIDIVQGKMQITGTTAREASGTISGSIDTMKAAFQNFVTGLGMNNADIDMLLGNLVEAFQNVVTNIQPIVERLIDYIPGIVSAVIPVLQGMAPDLVRTAAELFTAFVNAIIGVLPDLIPVAIDAINLLSDTLIKNLPTIIEAGVMLIVGKIVDNCVC